MILDSYVSNYVLTTSNTLVSRIGTGGGTSSQWVGTTDIYNITGNVGIGTSTTPINLLELTKSTYTGALLSLDVGAVNAGAGVMPQAIGKPLLRLGRSFYSSTVGDYYGIGFGEAPLALSNSCCEIGAIITSTAGNETGDIVLSTRTGTTDIPATERMRITSAGNVGIGTTDPSTYKLNVNGSLNATNYTLNGVALNVGALSQGMTVQTKHLTYTQMDVKNNTGWDAINDDLANGFVIAITPASASSKILVNMIAHIGTNDNGTDSRWWGIKLYRKIGAGAWTEVTGANGTETGTAAATAGTPVWVSHNLGSENSTTNYPTFVANVTGTYMDAPATTSIVYYTAYWNQRLAEVTTAPAANIYINRSHSHGDAYRPAPSSSWTATEIWDLGTPYTPPVGDTTITIASSSVGISATPNANHKLIVNQGTTGGTGATCFPLKISAGAYTNSGNSTATLIGLGTETSGWSKCAIGHCRTDTNDRGSIVFLCNNTADSTTTTMTDEKMRITSTGNVGIGVTVPSSKLTINNIVSDSNSYDHSESPLTITHQTGSSSTLLNDPKTILHLCRQGASGQAFGGKASFKLCRWENNGVNSRTRLDITLAHGQYDDTNIICFKSDGTVGIGTNNPLAKLHIVNSSTAGNPDTGITGIYVYNPTNTAGQNSVITNRIGGSSAGSIIYGFDVTGAYGYSIKMNGNSSALRFNNNWEGAGTDRLVLANDGTLSFANDTWHTSIEGSQRVYYAPSSTTYLRGHGTTPIIFKNGGNSDIANLNSSGYLTIQSGATINGDVLISSTVGKLVIRGNAPTLYLRDTDNRSGMIHMNGNIMYFLNADGNDSETWAVQGPYNQWALTINMTSNESAFGGNLSAYGNVTAYLSDERLKTKTSDIKEPLKIINKLTGFYYTLNEVAKSYGFKNKKQEIGLSAQDVENVLPELVSLAPFDTKTDDGGNITSKSGNNYLTVSYDKLAPVFVEAIKELSNENEKLKKENNELNEKYNKLLEDIILIKQTLNLI